MMKRLLKTMMVILLFAANVSCSKISDMIEEVIDPKTEFETLEEINELAGTCLVKIPLNGISEEHYYMADERIAEYDITANGLTYCFRASKTLGEDISGIRIDGSPAFTDLDEKMSVNYEDKNIKAGRFVINGVQYTFTVKDSGSLSYSDFAEILSDARNAVTLSVYSDEIKELTGQYYDSYSMRAQAEISLVDGGQLVVDVTWSNSVSEYEEWIMFARYEGDRLSYDDSIHIAVVQTYNGEETVPFDDGGMGYFEIVDQKIYWTGSGDPDTENCVFEKTVQ